MDGQCRAALTVILSQKPLTYAVAMSSSLAHATCGGWSWGFPQVQLGLLPP